MFKKALILILVLCLMAAPVLAEFPGNGIGILLPDNLEAGHEAEAVITCASAGSVTVNASMIYPNGTADLILIGRILPLEDGKASLRLTPPHAGTLRVEAYYSTDEGEESSSVLSPVTGPEEIWPEGSIEAPDAAMVQDPVQWAITPSLGEAPYTVRYQVTLISEDGTVDNLGAMSYRSDGEKVYHESYFSHPGKALLEAEIIDHNGLKAYAEKQITIEKRPFYSDVDTTALIPGDSIQVHPYKDDEPWHFESSDEDIISVEEHGRIHALKEGSATISVTNDTIDHAESITFVVSPEVQSITCDDVILPVGQSAQLQPVAEPQNARNDGYVYVSANPEIISVDESGRLTALTPGQTSIVIISKGNPAATATIHAEAAGENEKIVQPFTDGMTFEPYGDSGIFSARYGSQQAEGSSDYTLTLKKDGVPYAIKGRSQPGQIQFSLNPLEEGEYTLETTVRDENGHVATSAAGGTLLQNAQGEWQFIPGEEDAPETLAEDLDVILPDVIYAGIGGMGSAVITPRGLEADIQWTSSNPDVIAVSEDGTLTALKDGSATITATVLDHSGISASKLVTARHEALILEEPLPELRPGRSATLKITSGTGTGYTYTYTSTDESVITVDKGIVTAVGEGSAAVRIAAEGTSFYADVPVTVLPCLHENGQWQSVKAPTCTQPGEEAFLCADCGKTPFTRETAAAGHDRGRISTLIPATVYGSGTRIRTCTVCGDIIEKLSIPALQYTSMHNNTTSVEGLNFSDYVYGVTDWLMFAPVDLTYDHVSTHRLIASNMLIIGTVTVKVENGQVTASYDLLDDDTCVTDEFVTFLTQLPAYGPLDMMSMRRDAFEKPVSIADDLASAPVAYLFVMNRINYNGCDGPYPRYDTTDITHQQAISALRDLMR